MRQPYSLSALRDDRYLLVDDTDEDASPRALGLVTAEFSRADCQITATCQHCPAITGSIVS